MLAVLARASLEGAIVAALVWIAIRWLPRLSPATRAALWWCAAAKFLLALVWVTPVELRVLPARAEAPAALSRPAPVAGTALEPGTPVQPAPVVSAPAGRQRNVDWPVILLVLWSAGLVAGAAIDLRRLTRTRRVIRRSSPATEQTAATAAELAAAIGLRRTPTVHISSETATPLVVGVLRPRILLPGNGATPLSEDEERMALCHELSHVKRADLWLGLVPAAAERLFFFHPFVRLASREYLLCREAACDAAVIDTLAASPQDYGRLLLSLGVSRHRSSLAVAGASSSCSMLKRRIAMLRDSSPSSVGRRVISAVAIAAAVAAAVPLRLTARAQAPPPLEQPRATTDQAPAWHATDLSGSGSAPDGRGSVAARMRACCRAANRSREATLCRSRKRISITSCSSTTTTRTCPVRSPTSIVRGSFRRGGERLLWIRRNGVEYVVRDATADRSGPGDLEAGQRAWRRARRARRPSRARSARSRARLARSRACSARSRASSVPGRARSAEDRLCCRHASRPRRPLANAARWTTRAAARDGEPRARSGDACARPQDARARSTHARSRQGDARARRTDGGARPRDGGSIAPRRTADARAHRPGDLDRAAERVSRFTGAAKSSDLAGLSRFEPFSRLDRLEPIGAVEPVELPV